MSPVYIMSRLTWNFIEYIDSTANELAPMQWWPLLLTRCCVLSTVTFLLFYFYPWNYCILFCFSKVYSSSITVFIVFKFVLFSHWLAQLFVIYSINIFLLSLFLNLQIYLTLQIIFLLPKAAKEKAARSKTAFLDFFRTVSSCSFISKYF